MAGGIKGITVKIGGDTTELGRSLKEATTQSKGLQSELKGVNSLLKFDPKNITLLKQKQDLLKKSIEETKAKQEALNEVLKKVDSGEIQMTESEYRNLQREIQLTDQQLKQLTDQQKEFGSVGAQVIADAGKKVEKVGDSFQSVGQKLLPVTAGIGAIGASVVKTTADFDSSMSNVGAISGATGDDLQALRDKAREMGAQTKFSASESADAMSYMAMAGWKTNDMLNGIAGVMDLASASGEDLAKTSDILTDGLTAFGLSASDSSRMADVMASASSNANTNVSLLGESYKYCASTAGAMGYSLEDITESLGLMANAGVKGSQAGTTLKNAMINLAKPTDSMKEIMDKYHISITNTDGSMKTWNQVVDELRSNLGGLSEATMTSAVATLFGKESASGMMALIKSSPADVEKLNQAINNSTGSAKAMSDTMNDNLNGQLTILKSQLEELSISFGEMLMPIIRDVVSAIQGFVDKLNHMDENQRKVIITVLAVVACIAPLLIAIGKLLSSIGVIMQWTPKLVSAVKGVIGGLKVLWGVLMANPIVLIIALITALVAGFVYAYTHCEKFKEIVDKAFTKIKEVATDVVNAIVKFFTVEIPTAVSAFKDNVKPIVESFKTFFNVTVPNTLNAVKTKIKSILDSIKNVFTTVWTAITSAVSKFVDTIKNILWIGFALILNIVVPIINAFLDLFTTVFTAIKNVVTTVWNAIKTATTTAWNAIVTAVTPIVNSIRTTITNVFNAIKNVVSSICESIKSVITTAWNNIRTVVTNVINSIKTVITNVWNSIRSVTSSLWNSITSVISNAINSARNTVSSVVNGIKSTVSNAWNAIKSTTSNIWNGIKNAIMAPINSARDGFSNAINSMKNALNFHWSLPHLSLPHISVSGGKAPFGIAGKGSLPKFNVSWYAKGAVFDKPTILDTESGFKGVGEAGAEAVAPIDVLQKYVREAVVDRNQVLESKLDTVINLMSTYYPDALNAMDRPVVIGVDSVDSALSDKSSKLARGW